MNDQSQTSAISDKTSKSVGIARRFFFIWLTTWGFWSLVALWNFSFLAGLAIWLFLPVYLRFLDFMWPPLLCAVAASIAALVFFRPKGGRLRLRTLVVNAAFLVTFVAGAEARRAWLMSWQMDDIKPDCWYSRSFLTALAEAGQDSSFLPHAVYVKDGRVFVFSYRTVSFFEVSEATYRNIDLGQCRSAAKSATAG